MIHAPTGENIAAAANILQSGGVVGVPTETVYGLAGSIRHPGAIAEIFRRKGRPHDNPLIVHVASLSQAYELTTDEGRIAIDALCTYFWPGPLTIVVPASKDVPDAISVGLDTVAIRMPAHPVFLDLIRQTGSPLAAPSANVSGRPSPTRAEHVLEDLGDDVFILDGGPCEHGIESTVVQITGDVLHILRPGAISREQLEERWGGELSRAQAQGNQGIVRSPGVKYRHYSPSASVVLSYSVDDALSLLQQYGENTCALIPASFVGQFYPHTVRLLSTVTLFDEFRRADALHTGTIVVLCDESVLANEALINRLRKAAGIDGKG